jgi:hypothetical protein
MGWDPKLYYVSLQNCNTKHRQYLFSGFED